MFLRAILVAAVALCAVVARPAEGLAQLATVLSTEGNAAIVSGGRRTAARDGANVRRGDRIETDESGRVLLLFADETRIAVGPRSNFEVTDVRIGADSRASRFSVRALNGTYRFLSGKSEKDTYRINTPTAVLGVRGTEFDFFVDRRIGSHVALFRGEVVLCPAGGRCALVRGDCTLALSDLRGNVGLAPSRDDKNEILVRDFPFVVDQSGLPSSFRTSTGDCGNLSRVVVERVRPILQVAPPGSRPLSAPGPRPASSEPAAAPRQAAPASQPVRSSGPAPTSQTPAPAPEPPPPPQEFPGQSGTDTPNVGRGNDTSRGQDGTGTGSGRGAENRNASNNGAFGDRGETGSGRDNGKGKSDENRGKGRN